MLFAKHLRAMLPCPLLSRSCTYEITNTWQKVRSASCAQTMEPVCLYIHTYDELLAVQHQHSQKEETSKRQQKRQRQWRRQRETSEVKQVFDAEMYVKTRVSRSENVIVFGQGSAFLTDRRISTRCCVFHALHTRSI